MRISTTFLEKDVTVLSSNWIIKKIKLSSPEDSHIHLYKQV